MGKSFQIVFCAVLFAADVVVAARTLDWETNKCRPERYYQTGTLCSDFEAAIACLEKADKFPSLSAIERNEIDYSLILFRDKKQIEDKCPNLKARGSCFDDEFIQCMNRTGDCDGLALTLGCLIDLNATCTDNAVLKQIDRVKTEVDRCERGVYKCHDEIRGCVQEFEHLKAAGRKDDACKEIPVAERCLDLLKCESIYSFKYSIAIGVDDYKKQCL